MLKSAGHFSTRLLGPVCGLAVLAAGVSAFGQGAGQFTVIGHNDRVNEDGRSASVSYGDLDLTTKAGRSMLRHRMWNTAAKLCARLGEGPIGGDAHAGSCADGAFIAASGQVHDAVFRATRAAYAGTPSAAPNTLTMTIAAAR
jgi:UrcA family protein